MVEQYGVVDGVQLTSIGTTKFCSHFFLNGQTYREGLCVVCWCSTHEVEQGSVCVGWVGVLGGTRTIQGQYVDLGRPANQMVCGISRGLALSRMRMCRRNCAPCNFSTRNTVGPRRSPSSKNQVHAR